MPTRPPRPLTPESVKRSVLAYVQRYSAPRAHTRRRWMQRIQRQGTTTGEDTAPLVAALDAVLDLGERYRFVSSFHRENRRSPRPH